MDNIYTYFVELPDGIDEAVMPCLDGYTVYLDPRMSHDMQMEAYNHALFHILNDDFNKQDVQQIESDAHNKERRR